MKLVYAAASPFVRKVRVVALETGQDAEIELMTVKTAPTAVAAEVAAANPLGKLPALIRDDGPAIYDSRVITRYLDARAKGGLYPEARMWEVLTLEATADGIMDAAILVTYETRLRPAEQQSDAWREAQWSKAAGAVKALNDRWMSHLSGPLDAGQIAVGCALGYLDFRHDARNWRAGNDALAAWYEAFSKRPAMAATAPHD
jgi:glutathione S-transferase